MDFCWAGCISQSSIEKQNQWDVYRRTKRTFITGIDLHDYRGCKAPSLLFASQRTRKADGIIQPSHDMCVLMLIKSLAEVVFARFFYNEVTLFLVSMLYSVE